MKKTVDSKLFAVVCHALINSDAKSAVKYVDEKTVVRATWHNKPSGRNYRETMVVSFGLPNYLEREFIAKLKKAGESFPVKKVQFRPYPKAKKN